MDTNKRFFIVVNPVSGKVNKNKVIAQITKQLESNKLIYSIFYTKKDSFEDLSIKLALSQKKYTDLIIIGGDGTINETINSLTNFDIKIGLIPCGSGNDFVKCFSIGKKLEEQVHTAIFGQAIQVDIGKCNDRLFANGVGLGFDGEVVDVMENGGKKFSGFVSYLYTVLRILAFYKATPTTIQIDDQKKITKELFMLTIANGTTYGGVFQLAPKAVINDGLLEVCMVSNLKVLKRFLNLIKFIKGTHIKSKWVDYFRAKHIQIESNNNIVAHIDGEFIGSPPFDISIIEEKLLIKTKR